MNCLTKYSDSYSKTYGILWQYCRYVVDVGNDGAVNAATRSFNLKEK